MSLTAEIFTLFGGPGSGHSLVSRHRVLPVPLAVETSTVGRFVQPPACSVGSTCASAASPARRQHGSGSADGPAQRVGLRGWGQGPCSVLTCPAGTRKSSPEPAFPNVLNWFVQVFKESVF